LRYAFNGVTPSGEECGYEKMRKSLLSLITLFTFALCCYPLDIKKIEEIPLQQDKILIQRAMSFCVQKEENYFLVDYKARDIKVFNKQGKFIQVWGKQGLGPLEFGKPCLLEYREPYLAIMDLGKRKFMIYSEENNPNFSPIKEFYSPNMGTDMKLCGDKLLISGSKADRDDKLYDLYIYNFQTGSTDFLIPLEEKYGYTSFKQYKSRYDRELLALSDNSYCDLYKNFAYYVWTGDLRVIRVDLKEKKKVVFGHKTKNYTKLKMTKTMREDYLNVNMKAYLEYRKFSFLTGIIADENFVGVFYCNFQETKPGWQNYIQFYSPEGIFLHEKELPGGVNNDNYPINPFYYSQKTKILYFLSQTIGKDLNDIYSIIKYKIQ
jgi:hypothetical protein